MCAKTNELNTDWLSEQLPARQLLTMYCLHVANEDHAAFHWDGECGEVEALNPDGTRYYEMVPPPIAEFRSALIHLDEHFSIYEKKEITFEVPLESQSLKARIRLERRDFFPHLYCDVIELGIKSERDFLLKSFFADKRPPTDPRSIYTTIRGKVFDHLGQPVSGVRLADVKNNWRDFQLEKVQPGDRDSNMVAFSDDQGEFELRVQLTPGILDLNDVGVTYKSHSISRWQEATFARSVIESNPNDVEIRLAEPGELKVDYDFSDAGFAKNDYLQIAVYQLGYNHQRDIATQGELVLSGLIPGEYQIGVAAGGEQIVSRTVEVTGGSQARVQLCNVERLEARLHLKISNQIRSGGILPEGEELEFCIQPYAATPWFQSYWEWKLSEASLDDSGVFEGSYDLPPLLGGDTSICVVSKREIARDDDWVDTECSRFYTKFEIDGAPLSMEPAEFQLGLDSGLEIELRVEEVSS